MSNKPNKNSSKGNEPFSKMVRGNSFYLILLIVGLSLLGWQFVAKQFMKEVTVSPSVLMEDIQSGNAKEVKVVVGSLMANVSWLREGESKPSVTKIPFFLVGDYFTTEVVKELGDQFDYQTEPPSFSEVFGGIISLLLLVGFIFFILFFFRNMQQAGGGAGGALSFGKSRAKKFESSQNLVTFADIAGQNEAKYELQEVVDFLKHPFRYHEIGARIPRGVLLVGMPGTGKTLMARAVAGEAGVSFYHMSGSDFVEMFVGVGASRVRDLFEEGRKNAPCIIFIDELDAVGRTRGAGYGGGHDEREQTLNQMLVEMDGFDKNDNVIVLAATNRPDVLDPALLRPGRFDRQVVVDMPDVQERTAILEIHSKKIKLSSEVDLVTIAKATPGSSGADLANLVNEAALHAARDNRKKVGMIDFEEARDKILMGLAQSSRLIEEKEKWATAYHEAGHALLHYFLKNIDPLHKVTIIPRGRAAGVTFSLPEKDHHIPNKSELLDKIKLCMGGYVAEEIFYGETTAGTQQDIKQATKIARKMVREWGMSDLGFVSYGEEDEPIFIGREITQVKEYSEETSQKIDSEINKIITLCMKEVRTILRKEKSSLQKLAAELVAKETLDDAQIRELLNFPEVDKTTTIVKRKRGESVSSSKKEESKKMIAETDLVKKEGSATKKRKKTSVDKPQEESKETK